jgi:hypothetical protein
MKKLRKNLLSVTFVGLSAWLLVIGLLIFDNRSNALLKRDGSVPQTERQQSEHMATPQTLGATDTAPILTHADHGTAETSPARTTANATYTTWHLVAITAGAVTFVGALTTAFALQRHKQSR